MILVNDRTRGPSSGVVGPAHVLLRRLIETFRTGMDTPETR
jgi:hypothetical protein